MHALTVRVSDLHVSFECFIQIDGDSLIHLASLSQIIKLEIFIDSLIVHIILHVSTHLFLD